MTKLNVRSAQGVAQRRLITFNLFGMSVKLNTGAGKNQFFFVYDVFSLDKRRRIYKIRFLREKPRDPIYTHK